MKLAMPLVTRMEISMSGVMILEIWIYGRGWGRVSMQVVGLRHVYIHVPESS